NDGDAACDRFEPVFVRPQRNAREGIDETIAVWPDERHARGGGEELILEMHIAGFGEARSVDDGSPATFGSQSSDDLDRGLAFHCDECGIGLPGDLIDGADAGHAAQMIALGMDSPDLALKPKRQRACDGDIAFLSTDE